MTILSYTETETLDNWFTYHAPKNDQQQRYQAIREAGKALATTIITLCPEGKDTDAAILKVREAVMLANASIACGE